MKYRFTDEDKADLLSMGYPNKDLWQIQEAAKGKYTRYTLYTGDKGAGKRINGEEAIRILGRRVWLSGLARSAFHWTAMRSSPDEQYEVYFDSSRFFKDWWGK